MKLINRNVVWSALEAGGAAVFSVTSAFLVARLIGPFELGIGAAIVAVHVLLWVAVNSLFADAIVQRAQMDVDILSSAVWAATAAGVLAMPVQIGMGWLLAEIMDDPRLLAMAIVLAAPLPFVGMGGALQGKLTRERRYRILAARTLIGQGVGMVTGIVCALQHAGAWAPVAQQAVVSAISAGVLIAAAGWRPAAMFDRTHVQALLRTGLPLTASTLVQIGRYRVFALLIGATSGPAALGQVHIAFRLVDTLREITFTALWRLLLPILSEFQHDRDAMLAQVDRLTRLSSWVTMPVCGALLISLVPLTTMSLGPMWREAGEAALPLAGLMALLALMFPSGVALIAMGMARFTLYANLAGVAATVVLVLAFGPDSPWPAVLVWCAAQLFVSPFSLWVNGRALGVGPLRPLREGVPALLVTAFAVTLALALAADDGGSFESLARRGAIFAAVLSVYAGARIWGARVWRIPAAEVDIAR